MMLGAGVDSQGRSLSFLPILTCPVCDSALAHSVQWSRFYNAVYFIFVSFVLLVLLFPLTRLSLLLYILASVVTIAGFWALGKMLIVPLRLQSSPLLQKVLTYFAEFGFRDYEVKSDVFDPADLGNAEVILHMGHLRLRIIRDGAQEYVEFGDSDALYGRYYAYDDVFVAHGWLTPQEVAERDRAIGLYDACRGIKKHLKELAIIFDPQNVEVALTRIRLIREQRQEQNVKTQAKGKG